jgi:hypothetical protein
MGKSKDNWRTLVPGKSGKLEEGKETPEKKKRKYVPKKLGENPWGINLSGTRTQVTPGEWKTK